MAMRRIAEVANIEARAIEFANNFHNKRTEFSAWLNAKIQFKKGMREGKRFKKVRYL